MKAVWQAVVKAAKLGDKDSQRLFFDRLMGRPSQHVEVDMMNMRRTAERVAEQRGLDVNELIAKAEEIVREAGS